MTHIHHDDFAQGGRASTPKFRASLQDAHEPEGLTANSNGYELLTLVKRVGKGFGFSASMIRLLDHYMSFTRECDWQAGEHPIVFQSITKTAMQLGLHERQIQYLEKALFDLGALTWNDSGNHRRYGARDERTGELLYAFGVDLSPLASLKPAMEHRIEELEAEREAWHILKRQISYYRRQTRAMLAEAQNRPVLRARFSGWSLDYDQLASTRIRASFSVPRLRSTLAEHNALYDALYDALHGSEVISHFNELSAKISSPDDTFCVPYKITTESQTDKSVLSNPLPDCCLQASVPPPPVDPTGTEPVADFENRDLIAAAGVDHIRITHLISAASDRFALYLSRERPADTWDAIISAADALRPHLGIHNSAWIEACGVLGRGGAAICLLITDHNAQRHTNRVERPGGYFRAMIKKARAGELRLHGSIFGILKAKGETRQ